MVSQVDHFSSWEKLVFKLTRRWMSDEIFLRWAMKRWLGGGNIDKPRTFNEKIQWLKLHNRNPLYRRLVDKHAVRDYVREIIGDRYLNECYGVWHAAEEIDFDRFPARFVLKATHGSGMNLLVPDRRIRFDDVAARKQLRKWMATDYYALGREWAYKGVERRLLCERFLVDQCGNIPMDYKVFCFNGRPTYVQVDVDRFGKHTRAFFDTEWVVQDFGLLYEMPKEKPLRPEKLAEIIECAGALSSGIPFVRVDFYAIPDVIFGEMTFYPESGFAPFYPWEYDEKLGWLIELPEIGL